MMASGSQKLELVPFELRDVEGLEDDLEQKGCGSFGAVYEVSLYGLPCIAKSLHSILLGYESRVRAPLNEGEKKGLREKFEDECILLSKLNHPNIVKFVGVYYGMYTGELSLIMEKLHIDLGNYVEKNPSVPDSIKASLLLDASCGLLYLHSQNPPIIHRDLSAANVLVTTDCRAKIADVGVSTKYDTSTVIFKSQGQTVQPGAFAYMPPEALFEQPKYDTKLDIFSFGAIMLYVINHKFPEVHEVSFSEMKEGKVQLAKRKASVRKAADHSLFPIAAQCLEDIPQCRPTALELNEQLKERCPGTSHGQNEATPIKKQDLELADQKKKCNSLQEEVERLAQEVDQLQGKDAHMTNMNDELTRQIQRVVDDNETKQAKMAQKISECDKLMSQIVQLQETRVALERELQPLRQERADLFRENSCLKQKCDAWQEEVERLSEFREQVLQLREENTRLTNDESQATRSKQETERELVELRDRNTSLEQQLMEYLETTKDQTKHRDLELASMKEKCDAWQEEVERLSEFKEQVQQLREENNHLTSTNDELTSQIQSVLDEHEKKQAETAQKLSDYDTLMSRFVQLQETRFALERELQPLKQERADILTKNAELLVGSQAQNYVKLKQEYKELKKYCGDLQSQLEEQRYLISAHQDTNEEMQQKLDQATDLSIQERMERYKQERDTARKQVEDLKLEHEKMTEQLSAFAGNSENHLETAEQQVQQLIQEVTNLSAKASDYESRMRRYREERNKLVKHHDLELASMKEKCDAWQEEVERLLEFKEQVQELREENIHLTSTNDELTSQIQSVLDEHEKKQAETAQKLSDYDTLMSRFVQLQETRFALERELQPLKQERADILTKNAELLVGSQAQNYVKLKQEYKELKKYCGDLQSQLEEQRYLISAHQDTNEEMQQKLDQATDLSIQERMERYKQERDTARKQVEDLKLEHEKMTEQLSAFAGNSEHRLETAEQQVVQQLIQEVTHLSAKASDYESRMRRYREERNKLTTANKQLQEHLATLQDTVNK